MTFRTQLAAHLELDKSQMTKYEHFFKIQDGGRPPF